MIRSVLATSLRDGDVMALPFGKTATVSDVRVGRIYVSFRTEHGPTRVGVHEEVLLEVMP